MPINGLTPVVSVWLLAPFLQACRATAAIAQVIELSPADLSVPEHLYPLNTRGVNQEGALDANAVGGNSAYGEGAVDPLAPAKSNDGTLEGLNSLTLALNNTNTETDGVSDSDVGHVRIDHLAF